MEHHYFGIGHFGKKSQQQIVKTLRDKGIGGIEGTLATTDMVVEARITFNGNEYSGAGFRTETAVSMAYRALLGAYLSQREADKMVIPRQQRFPLPRYEDISL